MKKLIIITLCVLGLYSCGQKRPAIIERPVFDVSNTKTIEIDKIEMSDSATVFYVDAYLRPNYWMMITPKTYIRESGSDEKLMVIRAEGININENIIMPESGTISFKLFFPPLRPEVIKIDFIEDYPEGWKILGIHLLPNAKIKFDPILKEIAKTPVEPLPTPEYSAQPARISGKMLGYMDGIPPKEINIYATHIITGERIEVKLPVAEDGSFSGEITPGIAGFYQSSIGNLFLIPGKEVKIYIDLKKRSRFQSRYRTDKEPGDSIYTYISGTCFTIAESESIFWKSLYSFQTLAQETVNILNSVII